jgi:hypothetical protein
LRPLPHPQMSTRLSGTSAPASGAGTELPAPPDPTSTPASSDPPIAHASLQPPPPLGLGDNEEGPSGADSDGGEGALGFRVEAIRGLLEAHQFPVAEAACEASLADHPGHPEFLGLRSVLVLSRMMRGGGRTFGPIRERASLCRLQTRCVRDRAVSRLCQGRADEALDDATRAVDAWPHWGKVGTNRADRGPVLVSPVN